MIQLEEIEKIAGVSITELKQKLEVQDMEIDTAWISGSFVEGLGNPSSDIDIFVAIKQIDVSFPITRKNEDFSVKVHYSGSRRIDYEYWPIDTIQALCDKLTTVPIDDESKNILDYFTGYETEFIHRLSIGIPLIKKEKFNELKEKFNIKIFKRYMIENSRLYLDDAFDDTVGMHAMEDYKSGALRARYTVETSIDMLLFSYGVIILKDKHRVKLFEMLLKERPELQSICECYWSFTTSIPNEKDALKSYIEDALSFAEDIVDNVQRKWREKRAIA